MDKQDQAQTDQAQAQTDQAQLQQNILIEYNNTNYINDITYINFESYLIRNIFNNIIQNNIILNDQPINHSINYSIDYENISKHV